MSVSCRGVLAFVNASCLRDYVGQFAKPSEREQFFATWIVDCLTRSKIIELQVIMVQRSSSAICVQETHKAIPDHFVTEEGSLIVLSGPASDDRENPGDGFVVAPHRRQHTIGFKQVTPRMVSLK